MLCPGLISSLPVDPISNLNKCDVVWTSPSLDAAGSMPIGNGEVVLNVWVEEKTGDLLFYIARTDALSEISRFLKLSRVRIHLSPSQLKGKDFRQHLHLHDGTIEVSGGGANLVVFVDPAANVVHVAGRFGTPLKVDATVECWRNSARVLPKEAKGSAWAMHDAPFDLIELADEFDKGGPTVTWYHRNETSVAPKLWANQSLTSLSGRFDPILHRTFGGRMEAEGFTKKGDRAMTSNKAVRSFDLKIATASAQTSSAEDWRKLVGKEADRSDSAEARKRCAAWWREFWARSFVFVEGDGGGEPVPVNDHALLAGVDASGNNKFPGEITDWQWLARGTENVRTDHPAQVDFSKGMILRATIKPTELKPGRIFDKVTPGGENGFLFDTHPGDSLRLIVGRTELSARHCLKANETYHVSASYDPASGEASIYQDGKRVAYRAPQTGSPITRGYTLQRFVQACQGRGTYPIKFNGGYYTVEPAAMGKPFDPDFRNWGDCHWWQNVRHMYHPMLAQGDIEMMEPLFRLYESVVPLAEARSKAYHNCEGAYFPETMTVFGTYSGGDYGWDRKGHLPKDVLCPWWQYAWNQGPELVALMLDRWDYTLDTDFLKKRALPMAEAVLKYFDTRFAKNSHGKIILDPAQVVETYWEGVVNDMPSTAGLIAITNRLNALPAGMLTPDQKTFFSHMKRVCPDLPLEMRSGRRQLAPAQQYVPKTTNVENGELYAVWPFQVVSLGHPALLPEAKNAYEKRLNHLDTGWGYDGNVAALLGLTDESARILKVKCANSNPAYRWPATWGPNFDWLPDQNHGGNLLNTTNLMLLQSDPIEEGGAIRLLPAWPKAWDVDFKLRAMGNTIVKCRTKGGKIVELVVDPPSRKKDIVWPVGWLRP